MSEEVEFLRNHLQMLEDTLAEQETVLRKRYEVEIDALRRRNSELEAASTAHASNMEEVLTLRLVIVEKDAAHAQLRRNLSHAIDTLEWRLAEGERTAAEERARLLEELEKQRGAKEMLMKEVEALHNELQRATSLQIPKVSSDAGPLYNEADIHSVREALKAMAQRYRALKGAEGGARRPSNDLPPEGISLPPSTIREETSLERSVEPHGATSKSLPMSHRSQRGTGRHHDMEVHPYAQHYLDALALQEQKVRALKIRPVQGIRKGTLPLAKR